MTNKLCYSYEYLTLAEPQLVLADECRLPFICNVHGPFYTIQINKADISDWLNVANVKLHGGLYY